MREIVRVIAAAPRGLRSLWMPLSPPGPSTQALFPSVFSISIPLSFSQAVDSEEEVPCWSCGAQNVSKGFFCDACGAIQPKNSRVGFTMGIQNHETCNLSRNSVGMCRVGSV